MSLFGTTLHRILEHRDLTAREVCAKSGVDPAQLSRWMNTPRFATISPNALSRIARAAADTKDERAQIIAAYLQDILGAIGETQIQIHIREKPFTAALPKKSDALLSYFRREFIARPQIEQTLLELAKALGYSNTHGNTNHESQKHSRNTHTRKP